jgi:NodT family efflux transporter outer membrane factor (OMF) lipoprotein
MPFLPFSIHRHPGAGAGMTMKFLTAKLLLASSVLMLLSACDFAPFYHRPPMPVPPAFKEQNGWVAGNGSGIVQSRDWWRGLNDPVLDDLEGKVITGNQNLKAAIARYDQARAELYVARAALFPTLNGEVNATRERESETTESARSSEALGRRVTALDNANGIPASAGGGGKAYSDYLGSLDLSYEVDVWGRVRNAVKAAGDNATASADDVAAMALDLHAQAAVGYFTVRGYDAQIDILQRSLKAYQAQLTVTRNRYKGGIALISDVDQAEVAFDNAQATLNATTLKRAQAEHALAVLIGEAPASFTLAKGNFAPKVPPIDPGIPSDLLRRRPDIAASERRVAAANAEIGVARAAFFPTFDLAGTLGFESSILSQLLKAPSLFWSAGPQTAVTLIDGGRIAALTTESRAVYEEAAANYRETVLEALQGVEDDLASLRDLAAEAQSQADAAQAADRALQQENDRYRGGIDTYLNVITEENSALQAKLALTNTQIDQAAAYVHLIEALGGGWDQTQSTTLVSRQSQARHPQPRR